MKLRLPLHLGDIMLEKEPGNAGCNRLWILALFESDFDNAKFILIARKVGYHLEDNDLAPKMQFGSRPGKNCHSAVLNKVLSHDIVHLNRSTAAFIENDAIGCYDRLMNNLLLLILLWLGMPSSITQCMGIYGIKQCTTSKQYMGWWLPLIIAHHSCLSLVQAKAPRVGPSSGCYASAWT